MSTATLHLEVDWDDSYSPGANLAGGGMAAANSDVIADMISIRCRRGNFMEGETFWDSPAAVLEAKLDNSSGKYNADNGGSVLAGLITEGHWVLLTATEIDGTPLGARAYIWGGRLVSLDPDIEAVGQASTATLKAVSDRGFYAKRKVLESVVVNGTPPAMFLQLRTEAGLVGYTNDPTDLTSADTITAWSAENQTFIEAAKAIAWANGGHLHDSKFGLAAFFERRHRISTTGYTSQATFSDAPAAARTYSKLRPIVARDYVYNEFNAEYRKLTAGSLAILWTLSEQGASSPSIADTKTRAFWARYPNPASATDALKVNVWTTPVATTDYLANSAADGSGSNETGNVSIAVSKSASFMKISITNNAGITVYITHLQARGTPLTVDDPVRVVASDATLPESRFPVEPNIVPWTGGSAQALDWANFMLAPHKSQHSMYEMTVPANRDATHYQEVFDLDLDERITLVANNSAGLSLASKDCFIEGIEHHIDRHKTHRVKYMLSEASASGGLFWVLDSSKLDTETALAY